MFATAADGTLRLVRLGPSGDTADPDVALPLVELTAFGHGSGWSGPRFTGTAFGGRLRYRGHRGDRGDGGGRDGGGVGGGGGRGWERLTVELHDAVSGLTAFVELSSPVGVAALRSRVRLRNDGTEPIVVQSVSSLLLGGLPSPGLLDVHRARNDWLAECRWYAEPLRATVADIGADAHQHDSRAALSLTGRGSWPSDGHLPMGALTQRGGRGRPGRAWVWQVESPAGWRWDLGERAHGTYLAVNGPTDAEHQWRVRVAPGEEFTTVGAVVALGVAGGVTSGGGAGAMAGSAVGAVAGSALGSSAGAAADAEDGSAPGVGPGEVFAGLDEAFAALTAYRRAVRRPHPDHEALPVVFNDYMNTLMGDPTTEKLLPLIDAAAEAGAEYFCIDSGWYDDTVDGGWWDSVGAWLPSPRRFPQGGEGGGAPADGGIRAVLERIRERGMVPGLWLEPEVVGVRSAVAAELPDDAFFQRDGVRLAEQGRHQLDLRHPAARAHLDRTVDRIVGDWGVGYLKLDYNIVIDPGTTAPGDLAPGAGLLGHAHAYLDWLSAVLDRHPRLVVENCASGGMRMDGATLAVSQLQSTSDQQDPLRYPPIAAAAPTAVPPEQGAVWAYPQPEYDDDLITLTLGGALLGRIHLSGHLDRMTARQLGLVREAVATYKSVRADLAHAEPFWPLGLPGWTDEWLALGMRVPGGDGRAYLSVWRRGGEAEVRLPVAHLAGRDAPVRAEILHPSAARTDAAAAWDPATGELRVSVPRAPGALLIRLTAEARPEGL
ncbi:alpha-galactosidase [Streptomyces griseiscabiei]|uniref:Alpha-galactosidase n=1 Tax=Streptomyces griseiscabiei TaxID=2993540 RepID=A0ABU4LCX9_9ACTN|nr:glycoside hydrolase family 36 protein [Streptomyces griseiscabiei]MDX2913059.1 alpha-galactosidase [Streptomyces griseiscabiei]